MAKKIIKEIEEIKVEAKEPESNKCWYCGKSGYFEQCKGDHNQYKFCSTECFNKDNT